MIRSLIAKIDMILTYNPYANITFGYNDEIRILIQQNLYTLPCEFSLHQRKIDEEEK